MWHFAGQRIASQGPLSPRRISLIIPDLVSWDRSRDTPFRKIWLD